MRTIGDARRRDQRQPLVVAALRGGSQPASADSASSRKTTADQRAFSGGPAANEPVELAPEPVHFSAKEVSARFAGSCRTSRGQEVPASGPPAARRCARTTTLGHRLMYPFRTSARRLRTRTNAAGLTPVAACAQVGTPAYRPFRVPSTPAVCSRGSDPAISQGGSRSSSGSTLAAPSTAPASIEASFRGPSRLERKAAGGRARRSSPTGSRGSSPPRRTAASASPRRRRRCAARRDHGWNRRDDPGGCGPPRRAASGLRWRLWGPEPVARGAIRNDIPEEGR